MVGICLQTHVSRDPVFVQSALPYLGPNMTRNNTRGQTGPFKGGGCHVTPVTTN